MRCIDETLDVLSTTSEVLPSWHGKQPEEMTDAELADAAAAGDPWPAYIRTRTKERVDVDGCVGEHGTLPAGIHRATLGEVGARFVEDAPDHTRERRGLILDAMRIHITLVRRLFYRHETRSSLAAGSVPIKKTRPATVISRVWCRVRRWRRCTVMPSCRCGRSGRSPAP